MIKLKRAYEKASKDDGFRILVDRLWPRGMSKEKEHLDLWLKDIAPSAALRNKIITFVYGAKDELYNNAVALKEIIEKS